MWAIIGWLGSWIVWFLVDGVLSDMRKAQIDKILSEMSPQALQKLKAINEKIEGNWSLHMDEVHFLDDIKAKIRAEQFKEEHMNQTPIPALPSPRPTAITPEWTMLKENPIPPVPNQLKRSITETGQHNIKQPKNAVREQAEKERIAKEQQRQQKIKEKQEIKQKLEQDYKNANGLAITNLSDMSPGMPVKATTFHGDSVYGVIKEIVFDRWRRKIRLEWNDRTLYPNGIAKSMLKENPIPKTPQWMSKELMDHIESWGSLDERETKKKFSDLMDNADENKRTITNKRQQSEDIINNVLRQKGVRQNEVKLILEEVGVESIEQLTDQQVEDMRKIVLGRDKGQEYWDAYERLTQKNSIQLTKKEKDYLSSNRSIVDGKENKKFPTWKVLSDEIGYHNEWIIREISDKYAEYMSLDDVKPTQFYDWKLDVWEDTAKWYANGDIVENLYESNERPINVGKLENPEQMPAILIKDNGEIINWHHRFRASQIAWLDKIKVIKESVIKKIWEEANAI